MCAKGLDAGEGFIVGADRRGGEVVYTPERTTYLKIPSGDEAERQITSLGLYTLKIGSARFVFGEDAIRIARTLKRTDQLRSPFRQGLPGNDERKLLSTILSAVLGAPGERGETVAYTVHGAPMDGQLDIAGIAKFWSELLAGFGYRPVTVGRAEAALAGEFWRRRDAATAGAALSIVFGEMAVDICARDRRKTIQFSLLRGSDWIDASVAKMKEVPVDRVRHLREASLDLTRVDLSHPLQAALEIYFEHQIHYTLQQVVAQIMKSRWEPEGPVRMVVSGSCVRIPGFPAKLEKGFKKVKMPFPLEKVFVSREPLQMAAAGALVRALEGAEKGASRAAPAPPGAGRSPVSSKGRISDIFKTATTKFAARGAVSPPAPGQPSQPAAEPSPAAPSEDASAAFKERLKRLEGRIAELEEEVLGEDPSYVEAMRQAAGIAGGGRKAREQDYRPFFELMVEKGASDLFLSAGARPAMRVDGRVEFISGNTLNQAFCVGLAEALSGKAYDALFRKCKGVDLAIELEDIGRFRANFFHQRGRMGGVFRYIKERVPTFEELNLPGRTLMKISAHQRGLVLVTGVAGSGKSTTIAGMLEHINQTSNRHIVTIEDPIEFVFSEKQSVIDQREVGLDTDNFMTALKSAVRQSPDVIFVGEMRDKETMEAAISAAETGHLVMSTLHTVNAQQTVERIITYFPPYQHNLIRLQLSMVLVGVLSVRLLPKKGGQGRVPALEIMLSTPTVKDLLLTGKTKSLDAAISEDVHYGNQTFNESLKQLYQAGVIDLEEALSAADNPDEFKLQVRGIVRGARASDFNFQ